jgi:hypothetical protein
MNDPLDFTPDPEVGEIKLSCPIVDMESLNAFLELIKELESMDQISFPA